jgi:hypothetical protein
MDVKLGEKGDHGERKLHPAHYQSFAQPHFEPLC